MPVLAAPGVVIAIDAGTDAAFEIADIALPLAAGVAYGVGIVLSPAVGAVLMSLSTVIVAINASLLKREA